MARKTGKPTTALTKLLYDNGLNGSELVSMGYFKNKSSVYGAAYRDVTSMRIPVLINIGKSINMQPGMVLDKLLELQEAFPPKKPNKVRS